jgi:hypothetical protein
MMLTLLILLGAGLIGWILLGIEDEGHWRTCKAPRRLEVEVPVMFADKTRAPRRPIASSHK